MKSDIKFKNKAGSNFFNVAPGVWGMKNIFVNLYMILNPFDGNWVLLDTGVSNARNKIKSMARRLFGEPGIPSSIILTHGHFDHTGAVKQLCEEWNVPVFAHYLELPFLTGISHFPPPDPTVGGGFMSLISFTYPDHPIDISSHIQSLPDNGRVPGLPEWKYIHTPGHSPGHISLFRENDGVLLAGDAFVTTKAESLLSTIFSTQQLSGPPKYFTYDWNLAKQSVKTLAMLEPDIAATGHGEPMKGQELRHELNHLSENFYRLAVPARGRYVDEPAVTNAAGLLYLPSVNVDKRTAALAGVAITAFVFGILLLMKKRK
ncbi:MAG: MBL fold metallo-hydrolase, partial [Ginsengibacter sp.]